MKVGVQAKRSNYIPLLIIGLTLLTLVKVFFSESNTDEATKKKETPSQIIQPNKLSKTFLKLVDDTESLIASHENLNIHLIEESGVLKILYIYKGALNQRQKSDRFFLHIYLKDPTLLQNKYKWQYENLNFDFDSFKPFIIKKTGVKYFIFQKELIHQHSQQRLLVNEISHISSGRNHNELGRSLTLNSIKIPAKLRDKINNKPLKVVDIAMSKAAYTKLKKKRKAALDNGILVTTDDDLVNAKIISGEEAQKVKLRLKGDWVDHLNHVSKWSFRLILANGKTAFGMRKVSVQHPKTRHYLWEWLFQKCVKDNDLVGLRYDFVDLNLIVTENDSSKKIPIGVMALEEFFDKILIENNRRREGVILAIDESISWEERENQRALSLVESRTNEVRESFYIQNSPIRVFNKNKVLADEKLRQQFHIAHDLFDGLRKGKYKVSEVFDLDKLTTFIAISNLFGNYHGFALENLRIYYNPITNKLEPIAFDANAGNYLGRIIQYPFSDGDTAYHEMLQEKLKLVSNPQFVNNLLQMHQSEIEHISRAFEKEFDFVFEPSILRFNSNYIREAISSSELEANL